LSTSKNRLTADRLDKRILDQKDTEQKVPEQPRTDTHLPQEKKRLQKTRGAPRLESSVFASGHDNVFTSGHPAIDGSRASFKKEKPKAPVHWPGEDTIIVKDNRKRQI
jgi:hypothetical protein